MAVSTLWKKLLLFIAFFGISPTVNAYSFYTVIFNLIEDDCFFPVVGFFNKVKGEFYTFEIGLYNYIESDSYGLQGGLFNITDGKSNGVQAGLFNSTYDINGAQIGLLNSVTLGFGIGEANGLQIGIFNTTQNSLRGMQVGMMNIISGSETWGTQAGFFNYNAGSFTGSQEGFINIANDGFEGAQIGVINSTTTYKGLQLGLFNLADSVEEGFPFGLLNLVKHGAYYAAQTGVSDYGYADIALKIGVPKSYNSFMVTYTKNKILAIGLGWGFVKDINDMFFFNFELNTIVPFSVLTKDTGKLEFSGDFDIDFRLIPQVGITLPGTGLSVVIGPALAFSYSPTEEMRLVYLKIWKSGDMELTFGFQAGIRIRLTDGE